jgi:uncharacterized protein
MTTTELVLDPGDAVALEILAGQELCIRQVEGAQVADLVSFLTDDPDERLSMFRSRSHGAAWRLSTGDTLVSTRGRPLWTIVTDTVGDNYTGGGYCNPRVNLRRYGEPGSATCEGNFERVLAPHGMDRHSFDPDTCFNVFMNVGYDADGAWVIRATAAAAGDHIVLRAEADQLLGLSNCPQLLSAVNDRGLKHLAVEVRDGGTRSGS